MESEGMESLPLYPEGRPAVVFTTNLSRSQRGILRLLEMKTAYDT
jgi:hypothetical protein